MRRRRLDAVVETPLADPEQARAYRAAGYRIELGSLATAPAVTQLSVLDRYLETGRYISWDNLDECAAPARVRGGHRGRAAGPPGDGCPA
ncbi:zeta toxin family protein [Streptomyces libani]|uniref:zeta toxin family protein n=1 Tax=Streptomyces nigrescens TaxID=1920 RepID=UPI0038076DDD